MARVATFAGPGTVVQEREDGMIEIALDWKLAQGQSATAIFNRDSVTALSSGVSSVVAPSLQRVSTSAAPPLRRVSTFAGKGDVVDQDRRDGMIEIALDWKLAQGQSATAIFNRDSVTALAPPLRRVSTFAGKGRVVDQDRRDGMIEIALDWKLAQGQSATAIFNRDSVTALDGARMTEGLRKLVLGQEIYTGEDAVGDEIAEALAELMVEKHTDPLLKRLLERKLTIMPDGSKPAGSKRQLVSFKVGGQQRTLSCESMLYTALRIMRHVQTAAGQGVLLERKEKFSRVELNWNPTATFHTPRAEWGSMSQLQRVIIGERSALQLFLHHWIFLEKCYAKDRATAIASGERVDLATLNTDLLTILSGVFRSVDLRGDNLVDCEALADVCFGRKANGVAMSPKRRTTRSHFSALLRSVSEDEHCSGTEFLDAALLLGKKLQWSAAELHDEIYRWRARISTRTTYSPAWDSLGFKSTVDAVLDTLAATHKAGIAKFNRRDWVGAAIHFEGVQRQIVISANDLFQSDRKLHGAKTGAQKKTAPEYPRTRDFFARVGTQANASIDKLVCCYMRAAWVATLVAEPPTHKNKLGRHALYRDSFKRAQASFQLGDSLKALEWIATMEKQLEAATEELNRAPGLRKKSGGGGSPKSSTRFDRQADAIACWTHIAKAYERHITTFPSPWINDFVAIAGHASKKFVPTDADCRWATHPRTPGSLRHMEVHGINGPASLWNIIGEENRVPLSSDRSRPAYAYRNLADLPQLDIDGNMRYVASRATWLQQAQHIFNPANMKAKYVRWPSVKGGGISFVASDRLKKRLLQVRAVCVCVCASL